MEQQEFHVPVTFRINATNSSEARSKARALVMAGMPSETSPPTWKESFSGWYLGVPQRTVEAWASEPPVRQGVIPGTGTTVWWPPTPSFTVANGAAQEPPLQRHDVAVLLKMQAPSEIDAIQEVYSMLGDLRANMLTGLLSKSPFIEWSLIRDEEPVIGDAPKESPAEPLDIEWRLAYLNYYVAVMNRMVELNEFLPAHDIYELTQSAWMRDKEVKDLMDK